MQFTPKTAEEIIKEEEERKAKFLLKPGTYDFECMTATNAISKKTKNEMIKVELKVFGIDGSEHFVTDYLMEAMAHKFYHFAHGTGRGTQYDSGCFDAADCQGACGKVKIKVETDDFGTKNTVRDYVVPPKGTPTPADDPGDAIPGVPNPSKSHPADNEDVPDFMRNS